MVIIGLTGGIASGKSTVSRVLKDLGAIIIDADEIAHDIIAPHQPAWNNIIELFGRQTLNPDFTIDRGKLGKIVFNHRSEREALNHIVHPLVMERFEHDLEEISDSNPDAVVVLDVPLLFETQVDRMCDIVLVVWVDNKTQQQRLIKRNNLSPEEAAMRINAQLPLDEKAKKADIVIDNSGSIEETKAAAAKYYKAIIADT